MLSSAGNVDQSPRRWRWWVPEGIEDNDGVEWSTLKWRSCRLFWSVLEASEVVVMPVWCEIDGRDQVWVERRHSVLVAEVQLWMLVSRRGLHYSSLDGIWLVTLLVASWLPDPRNTGVGAVVGGDKSTSSRPCWRAVSWKAHCQTERQDSEQRHNSERQKNRQRANGAQKVFLPTRNVCQTRLVLFSKCSTVDDVQQETGPDHWCMLSVLSWLVNEIPATAGKV